MKLRFMSIFVISSVVTSLFVNVCGDQTERHEGLYSSYLDAANLIIPRKVNHKGEILSHNLTHHHHQLGLNNKLHYHIDFSDNETLHLELSPSTEFMGPGLVLERHKRATRQRRRPVRHNHCHYEGHIIGQEHHRVALSACNGIVGMIKTNRGDYWVEPSKRHAPSHAGHPHVIYQRSAIKEKDLVQHPKKKRRRRKKHRISNCGTREPKRMTETHIEWQHQGQVIVQGGRKTRKRDKRSVSSRRHVEALVVADSTMVEFHEEPDNVETYLLTMMNMVSSLYKDPTIGNSIQVVVVRMIVLEDAEAYEDLNVTHVASSTLDSFCRWQRQLNPKAEDDPHHHDVAILVTRKNICTNSGCAALGVANVGGMCRPDRSCSVNEDNGITLAHTITHELGHNFGMYHDTAKTGCENRIGPILHIMTPSFEADTIQVSWSNCSRRDITHFLDQGLGRCLEDAPTDIQYEYPELPPGAMYNADHQCRLQFNSTDEEMVVCSKQDEICSQLWCSVDKVCISQLAPAASGTTCGHHKWCQEQKCVEMEDLPKPVDGGWGNWSDWSECSRTCGGGVASRIRQCDHPTPAHGGTYCVGERAQHKTCNMQVCPDGEASFRAQQCSSHDNDTIKGQQYTWLPYFDIHEPCELYCTNVEDTIIIPFEDSAADGTPCNIGTNDMCIGGICRKVGCDWVVDSNTTVDQCGVCGGDGKTCTTIKSEFVKKLNMSEGYYEITMIPSGSRNILVEELGSSKNFIGIANANTKEFYLNGDQLISMSGEYEIAGSLGLYEREHDLEKLKLPGPTKDDISLFIVFRGKHKNVGIRYEYTLPANLTGEPIYYWRKGDWTACTATCGGGKKYRVPICHKKGEGIVDDKSCWENADNVRPEKQINNCNDDPCPAHWWIGPWQLCPVTCQKFGEPDPRRRRAIMCVDQHEIALPDNMCDTNTRPLEMDACLIPMCNTTEDSLEPVGDDIDLKKKKLNEDGSLEISNII